jgi:hypothetical protein
MLGVTLSGQWHSMDCACECAARRSACRDKGHEREVITIEQSAACDLAKSSAIPLMLITSPYLGSPVTICVSR